MRLGPERTVWVALLGFAPWIGAEEPWRSEKVEIDPVLLADLVAQEFSRLSDADFEVRDRAARALSELGWRAAGRLSQLVAGADAESRRAALPILERLSTEVRVRHIFVAERAEAERIAARIASGAPFEYMARSYSAAPSRAAGGDAGYLRAGDGIPECEEAAFALETGQVSGVVATARGFHLIEVTDRRRIDRAAWRDALAADPETAGREDLLARLEMLGAESWEDREAATEYLAEHGAPVYSEIETLGGHTDLEVRQRAARILAELRWRVLVPDALESAFPGVRAELQDADPSSQSRAIARVLGSRWVDDRAIVPLLEYLVGAVGADDAGPCCVALATLDPDRALAAFEKRADTTDQGLATTILQETVAIGRPEGLSIVRRFEGSADPVVRMAALEAALDLDPANVPAYLERALADLDPDVAKFAADQIGERAIAELRGALVARLASASDEMAQRIFHVLVIDFDGPLPDAEIRELGRVAGEHSEVAVRYAALQIYLEYSDRAGRSPDLALVAAVFAREEAPNFYGSAAQSLLEQPSPEAVPGLAEALGSADTGKRFYAVQILSEIGDPSALAALARAAGDESDAVRERILRDLPGRASPEHVRPILEAAVAATDPAIVASIETLLAALPPRTRGEGLIGALSHPEIQVAGAARARLAGIGTGPDSTAAADWESWWIENHRTDARTALADLDDENPRTRWSAARTLSGLRFGTVASALARHADDPVPWVKEEIAKALDAVRPEPRDR